MKSPAKLSPLLLVVFAALLWSTGGLFIKWTNLSGLQLSFFRCFFAVITVAIFTRKEGFGLNRLTVVSSAVYSLVLLLFVLATKQTTAANAIFLQYTAPAYLLILEPLLYKEKFRGRDLITVVACLGGMALFFVGQLRPQDVAGNILALASGLCFALYFLLLRHSKARDVNRASSVIYGSLLLVICTAPFGVPAVTTMAMRDLLIVLYLGIVQIGISYLLFTTAMARGVRSIDAGIVGYIEPVLNPVWVFLVLGERPSGWALIGGGIIIITVFCHMLVDAKQKRQARFESIQH